MRKLMIPAIKETKKQDKQQNQIENKQIITIKI